MSTQKGREDHVQVSADVAWSGDCLVGHADRMPVCDGDGPDRDVTLTGFIFWALVIVMIILLITSFR